MGACGYSSTHAYLSLCGGVSAFFYYVRPVVSDLHRCVKKGCACKEQTDRYQRARFRNRDSPSSGDEEEEEDARSFATETTEDAGSNCSSVPLCADLDPSSSKSRKKAVRKKDASYTIHCSFLALWVVVVARECGIVHVCTCVCVCVRVVLMRVWAMEWKLRDETHPRNIPPQSFCTIWTRLSAHWCRLLRSCPATRLIPLRH